MRVFTATTGEGIRAALTRRPYMDALLEPLPEGLRGYFDFEAYARDIFLNEYDLFNGFVYRKV
ncbi:Probable antirestriction protein (plasmid) [Erwinia tasmaniensis Et1/99]|uniref:Probable antirestriction protein n=1 Tax=Erwinia tasmaniensis (strain DSM 17950 / CFBP 7177 / CIP 109463 / NCPPB 4357 / Et1/99) TaxID=465817 RepID=B2VB25_ERWT9|nr:Probable antirestriction protein [Erwinia tasmaniensis Et1/99]